MSYSRYIGFGVIGGLRHGGVIIQNEKKIYPKKIHKCLDCETMIGGGRKKIRCVVCSDKYRRSRANIYHMRTYYKNNKYHHRKIMPKKYEKKSTTL